MVESKELARGITFSEVGEKTLKLRKKSLTIVSSYEIKLAIYFSVRDKKQFQLIVKPQAKVEENLQTIISENGGIV